MCNTRFCVTHSVQFVHHCTVLEPGKGLEIERTHKRPGSFKRLSAECRLFNFGEILIYLAAAQGIPPRQVGNCHTQDGVNNALLLITRMGRGSTGTNKIF